MCSPTQRGGIVGIYVWRDGQFRDKRTGAPMDVPARDGIALPQLMRDIPEYRSPIDGKPITSRSHRREDLKANGCVEYEPSLSPTKGKFRNPHFAAKRGIELSEEYR